MKRKIYLFIPLLLFALVYSSGVMAQYNQSRRNADVRSDRNGRYEQRGRYDRARNYAYRNEIRRRPSAPHQSRSIRPSSFHVWVGGDWMWGNGRYYYQPGYWAVPQRGHSWVPGHWQRGRHGWYWVNGFWKFNKRRW